MFKADMFTVSWTSVFWIYLQKENIDFVENIICNIKKNQQLIHLLWQRYL